MLRDRLSLGIVSLSAMGLYATGLYSFSCSIHLCFCTLGHPLPSGVCALIDSVRQLPSRPSAYAQVSEPPHQFSHPSDAPKPALVAPWPLWNAREWRDTVLEAHAHQTRRDGRLLQRRARTRVGEIYARRAGRSATQARGRLAGACAKTSPAQGRALGASYMCFRVFCRGVLAGRRRGTPRDAFFVYLCPGAGACCCTASRRRARFVRGASSGS